MQGPDGKTAEHGQVSEGTREGGGAGGEGQGRAQTLSEP